MIQKRITMVGSAQPFFSKWWCSGAMRKTRRPVRLNQNTWMMTDSVSTTNSPPTMASTTSCLVATATAPSAPPSARLTRVAHEHRRRRGVEPQEAQPRADQRRAEHRQLAGARHEVELQVVGEDAVADEVGDQREHPGGDHHRHDGQPVQPVGQVHRVGGADHHQHRRRGGRRSRSGISTSLKTGMARLGCSMPAARTSRIATTPQRRCRPAPAACRGAETPFVFRLVTFSQSSAKPSSAEAQGEQQHRPDDAVAQIRPEQGGHGERHQDEHAAHGGRALLLDEVALRPVRRGSAARRAGSRAASGSPSARAAARPPAPSGTPRPRGR